MSPRTSPRPRRRPLHAAGRTVAGVQPQLTSVLGRLVALVGVAAIGGAVLSVGGSPDGAIAPAARIAAADPATDPATDQPAGQPAGQPAERPKDAARSATPKTEQRSTPKPKPSDAAPAPRQAARPAAARAPAAKPWLPSGTGMWLYQFQRSNQGNAASIIARARRTGLSTLYLRTGSSWDGLSGGRHLVNLLRASKGTPVRVVAWDFPRLKHPVRDALRLARAARLRGGVGGPRVSAVAPDIETPAEGTFNAAWRVRTYLAALKRHLPKGVTVLGTVPWPSSYRIADYPYGAVAAGSDALVPMAYWYNNGAGEVTARSISYLRARFNKPVMPVGQGYDGKLDVPSLRHNKLGREVPKFFRTAKQHGARAVSLWSWQAAPDSVWRALDRASGMFARR